MTWLLLMVLLDPADKFDKSYLLNKFETYEECKTERDRIGFEMAEVYPYERDFVIVCEIDKRKVKQT